MTLYRAYLYAEVQVISEPIDADGPVDVALSVIHGIDLERTLGDETGTLEVNRVESTGRLLKLVVEELDSQGDALGHVGLFDEEDLEDLKESS